MARYRLDVVGGEFYEADSLAALLLGVLRHRWWHWRRGDGWRD